MLTGTLSPVSNKSDWIEAYELIDTDTDEPIDISDATEITISIRENGSGNSLLTATLSGDTIEHIEPGIFQWAFTSTQMRTLCANGAAFTYEVGCTIEKDEITTQLLIGYLPVVDGIVS